MLDIIRKNAASWLMKFILGAIVVVFIFWGVGTFRSQRLDIMAKVNDDKILVEEYQKAYNNTLERLRKMYGGSIPEGMLQQMNFKQQVLDQLIDNVLLRQEADRVGITVTDKEIQQAILNIPAFKHNGVFDRRLYEMALRNARLTPVDFEKQVRQEMLTRKFQTVLTAGLYCPDSEALLRYKYNNAELNIEYFKINASECVAGVNATEERLRGWYEEHKEEFRTSPEIKLKYLLFAKKDFEKDANVTQAEIQEYYDLHETEFHQPEERRARHILVKVGPDANATKVDAARKRAMHIYELLKKGKDFSRLAKEFSDDIGTAKKGGDLGFFRKGMMIKPFEEKVFSMKEGEISEPIRSRFGWHIIRLDKIKPDRIRPLNEVKAVIARKLKNSKVEKAVWDAANKAYDALIDMGSLDAYAESENMQLKQTDFFPQDRPDSILGFNPQIVGTVFSLEKGEFSSLLEVPKGVLIAELLDKRPPYIPEFKDVKAKVERKYTEERSLELCRERSDEILRLAREKGFGEAGKKFKLKAEETGFFKRTDLAARGKLPSSVVKEALSLYKNKSFPEEAFQEGRSFYVLHLKDTRELDDLSGFESEKDKLKRQIMAFKISTVFSDWLKHQRERAEIEIIRKP